MTWFKRKLAENLKDPEFAAEFNKTLQEFGVLQYFCDEGRHLVCVPYSVENLHRMADELGIKRCWFHNGSYAHYDIPKRRRAEIESKCTVVSGREILAICRGEKG